MLAGAGPPPVSVPPLSSINKLGKQGECGCLIPPTCSPKPHLPSLILGSVLENTPIIFFFVETGSDLWEADEESKFYSGLPRLNVPPKCVSIANFLIWDSCGTQLSIPLQQQNKGQNMSFILVRTTAKEHLVPSEHT